jgi:hypothetical protein
MTGWVGHRAGRNSAEKIKFHATAGNRNTIPRTSGHFTVTVVSNDTNQCESNSSDNDYYFVDDDGYCNNDNDIGNDNSLTEEAN